MKNITKQYQDLLEGKMSKDNFMRNARMQFPQWISPVNSFTDAIKVLKSKRLISEAGDDFEKISRGIEYGMNPAGEDPNQVHNVMVDAMTDEAEQLIQKMLSDSEQQAAAMDAMQYIDVTKFDTALEVAQEAIEQAKMEYPTMFQGEYDDYDTDYEEPNEPFDMAESLNEAEKKDPSIDQVDYRQLRRGTEFEMSKMPMLTDENYEKAKQKAYKNLVKDPNAYRHLVVANYDEVEKKDKTLRYQDAKGDNTVDKPNGYKRIKKDATANTKDNLGKKEKAKGTPEGMKLMKEADLTKSPAGLNNLTMSDAAKRAKKIHDEEEAKRKEKNRAAISAGKKLSEYEVGDEDDTVSNDQAAQEAVDILLPNLEDMTYSKSDLEDAFTTMEDKFGQHFDDDVFQDAIDILKQQGYQMVFQESAASRLKAEMLREFSVMPQKQVHHNKGSQVVTPEGKMGTIEELTPDGTATVLHEDGSKEDFQLNVLKRPDDMPKKEMKKPESKEDVVNKIKKEVKKMMDEMITAKTGDAAHDAGVLQRIGKIPNPSAKTDITKAFQTGKSVDV